MKIGFRTPSLKKSLKARTTSKYKRQLKSAIDPTYGKKELVGLKTPKKHFITRFITKQQEVYLIFSNK